MKKPIKHLSLIILLLTATISFAQTDVDERAMISFRRGLGFNAPDTSFGLNLRFRIQSRAGMITQSADKLSVENIEARVSRLRLRIDGYIHGNNISYLLQLAFSRSDQDWDNTKFPNIIRDAMIYYRFNPKFYIGFGQGKLPGNRENIISSGQQQFVDRSIVNGSFSLDRDFGLMAYYSEDIHGVGVNFKGAVSSGEGRNAVNSDEGLSYTGRIEVLPLGDFINNGDFSEGDLDREESPKLSLGAGYSVNVNAPKTRGQVGLLLDESRDMSTLFADAIFKFKGFSAYSEFMKRKCDNPITNPDTSNIQYVLAGKGLNFQVSYLFYNNWELAGRYAIVTPEQNIENYEKQQEMYTLGVNRYIMRHFTKLQANLSYRRLNDLSKDFSFSDNLIFMIQVELGI